MRNAAKDDPRTTTVECSQDVDINLTASFFSAACFEIASEAAWMLTDTLSRFVVLEESPIGFSSILVFSASHSSAFLLSGFMAIFQRISIGCIKKYILARILLYFLFIGSTNSLA